MEASPTPQHKPLDPLVKTALTLSISLIVITIIGMILTAKAGSVQAKPARVLFQGRLGR